jgi:hypothetical protein
MKRNRRDLRQSGQAGGRDRALQSLLKQLPTNSGNLFLTRCALALPATDLRRQQLLQTCLQFLEKLAGSDDQDHSASAKKDAISFLPKVKEALGVLHCLRRTSQN